MNKNALIGALVGVVLVLGVALVFALRPRPVIIDSNSRLPEIILQDSVDVKINSSREESSITSAKGAEYQTQPNEAGNVFLVCNLTVTNNTGQPLDFRLPFLRLFTSETQFVMGQPWESSALFNPNNGYRSLIGSGESITFDAVFDVPRNSSIHKIGYDSGERQ